jgi:arylsulfatase
MPKRPNILWYCTDQQRFDTIHSLGNTHIHTPRLDTFMREAVTFTHTYCQSPICTPSRASFLTGMYPSAVRVNGNGIPAFPSQYEDRLVTHRLAKAGYDCGLAGKLHLATAAEGVEPRVADGYRFFQYSHDHRGPHRPGHDYAAWIRAQGEDPADFLADPVTRATYQDGGQHKNFGGIWAPTIDQDNVPPPLHQTFWCAEKAMAFMEENRPDDQPWLMSVNPFDPHPPFDPPWDYFRRYDPATLPGAHFEEKDLIHQQTLMDAGIDFQSRPQHPDTWDHHTMQASYYAMIEQLDHEFGRLVDFLDATGQREDTIIIFTSDHGEALGDHGLAMKGCRFYEGSVRVPLMISWPGHFQTDVVSDALTELTDLTPTLYDVLDLEPPYDMQGLSLLPLLTGKTTAHRSFVRAEFYGAIAYPDQTHATMYRDRRWKLTTYHGKNLYELYDLEQDPWEHYDLSNDPNYQDIKWDLVQKSFDATVDALPPDMPRVAPY